MTNLHSQIPVVLLTSRGLPSRQVRFRGILDSFTTEKVVVMGPGPVAALGKPVNLEAGLFDFLFSDRNQEVSERLYLDVDSQRIKQFSRTSKRDLMSMISEGLEVPIVDLFARPRPFSSFRRP